MQNIFPLNIKFGEEKYEIKDLDEHSNIADLKSRLREISSLKPLIDFLRLSFDKYVHLENERTLKSYGIKANDLIYCEKYFDPKVQHEHGVDLESTDINKREVSLPCGHVADPNSLAHYVRHLLENGDIRLCCPFETPENKEKCEYVLELIEIKNLAFLSDEEVKYLEILLNRNLQNKNHVQTF
jgi:hypothetical protein